MIGRPDAGEPTGAAETPPPLTRDQARRAASHLRDFAASARMVAEARRARGPEWIANEHTATADAYEASADRLEYEAKRTG